MSNLNDSTTVREDCDISFDFDRTNIDLNHSHSTATETSTFNFEEDFAPNRFPTSFKYHQSSPIRVPHLRFKDLRNRLKAEADQIDEDPVQRSMKKSTSVSNSVAFNSYDELMSKSGSLKDLKIDDFKKSDSWVEIEDDHKPTTSSRLNKTKNSCGSSDFENENDVFSNQSQESNISKNSTGKANFSSNLNDEVSEELAHLSLNEETKNDMKSNPEARNLKEEDSLNRTDVFQMEGLDFGRSSPVNKYINESLNAANKTSTDPNVILKCPAIKSDCIKINTDSDIENIDGNEISMAKIVDKLTSLHARLNNHTSPLKQNEINLSILKISAEWPSFNSKIKLEIHALVESLTNNVYEKAYFNRQNLHDENKNQVESWSNGIFCLIEELEKLHKLEARSSLDA